MLNLWKILLFKSKFSCITNFVLPFIYFFSAVESSSNGVQRKEKGTEDG